MKKTRLAVLILLVAVCIAGWFMVATTFITNRDTLSTALASAQAYRAKKLYQLSLQQYENVLAEEPSEALYDEYLFTCKEYYDDCPTSKVLDVQIAAYQKAVEAYPQRIDYWTGYANIYYEKTDYDNLVKILKNAANSISFDETLLNYWNEAYYTCSISNTGYYTLDPAGQGGAYLAQSGDAISLVDPSGDSYLDFEYKFIGPVGQSNAVVCTDSDGESFVFLIDQDLMVGRFMTEIEQANGYGEGLIPVRFAGRTDWCYIDTDGNEYLSGYQQAGMFQNGKAAVQMQDGAWHFIDYTGAASDYSYEEIKISENGTWFANGVYFAKKGGVWNIYNEAGEQQGILDAEEIDANKGSGIAFKNSDKWGFATLDGTVVIEPQYDDARSFSGGVAAVCKDDKWGFINTSNTLVIDYLFDDATYFDNSNHCPVRTSESETVQMLTWRVARDQ